MIGDTHSTDITFRILNESNISDCDIVHIGDGGWGFGKEPHSIDNALYKKRSIDKLLKSRNIRLFHIRGNHDNPKIWDFDSTENLIFVNTGDVAEFPNGKTVLFVGGGISVDRFKRTKDWSYWIMETTEYLNPVPQTDFVFSHDCPDNFNHSTATLPDSYGWYVDKDPTLMDDCKEQRENMRRIWHESGAKIAIYGHFHNSKEEEINGVRAKCLDINELYEFNAEGI